MLRAQATEDSFQIAEEGEAPAAAGYGCPVRELTPAHAHQAAVEGITQGPQLMIQGAQAPVGGGLEDQELEDQPMVIAEGSPVTRRPPAPLPVDLSQENLQESEEPLQLVHENPSLGEESAQEETSWGGVSQIQMGVLHKSDHPFVHPFKLSLQPCIGLDSFIEKRRAGLVGRAGELERRRDGRGSAVEAEGGSISTDRNGSFSPDLDT